MTMIYELNWCAWTVNILALVVVLLGLLCIVLTSREKYEACFKVFILIVVLGGTAIFLRYSPWFIETPLY
jgi:hypothetical protein